MAGARRAAALLLVALAAAPPLRAQEAEPQPMPRAQAGLAPVSGVAADGPTFLYLNEERLLTGSRRGQALLAEDAAARDELRAEARRIDAAFEEEERALTERRAEMDPVSFRKLADAFDARVIDARRQQDERATALAAEFDQRRRQFYADLGPALVGLMERRGALAIFDESSVLLVDPSINITEEVIAEIDRAAPPQQDGPPLPLTPLDGGAPAGSSE